MLALLRREPLGIVGRGCRRLIGRRRRRRRRLPIIAGILAPRRRRRYHRRARLRCLVRIGAVPCLGAIRVLIVAEWGLIAGKKLVPAQIAITRLIAIAHMRRQAERRMPAEAARMARTAPHIAEAPAAAAAHYTGAPAMQIGVLAVRRTRAAAAGQRALDAAGCREVAENKTARYTPTTQAVAAAEAGVPCLYRRSKGWRYPDCPMTAAPTLARLLSLGGTPILLPLVSTAAARCRNRHS